MVSTGFRRSLGVLVVLRLHEVNHLQLGYSIKRGTAWRHRSEFSLRVVCGPGPSGRVRSCLAACGLWMVRSCDAYHQQEIRRSNTEFWCFSRRRLGDKHSCGVAQIPLGVHIIPSDTLTLQSPIRTYLQPLQSWRASFLKPAIETCSESLSLERSILIQKKTWDINM